jgi:hypothetical protein
VPLATAERDADARTPVVAEGGHFSSEGQGRIGGSCSRSQRRPRETTAILLGCHWAVAKPAQSLVLR